MDFIHSGINRRKKHDPARNRTRRSDMMSDDFAVPIQDIHGRRLPSARERGKPKKKLKAFRVGAGIDMPFMILVIVLLVCGIIMMFSASYPIAYYGEGNSYYYLIRQGIFALIGVAIMFVVSYVNYEYLKKLSLPILGLGFLFLFAVFFFPSSTGIHRWIDR